VLPKEVWDNVHIAYYNGSDLGRLSDDGHPNSSAAVADALKSVAEALAQHPIVSRLAEVKAGRTQVSVRPSSAAHRELVWRLVQQLAQIRGLAALRSTHSMDVVQPGVSKSSLQNHIRAILHEGCCVLSIGDKGQWPGNDYDLLSAPYSLSVDEVSADPETCWNIAPAGHRGTQAVLDYLGWIQPRGTGFRMALPDLGGPLP
jgi:hypothetical protein